jgi:hypothetical protein
MGAEVNCREASRLLSLGCDRVLSPDETSSLDFHLAKCLMCRNFSTQLKFLHQVATRFRTADEEED